MTSPEVPGNPEFDYLRKQFDGLCWWCGNPADSREHKYKHTDLKRMQRDGDSLLWGGHPDRYYAVRSIKNSGAVRFGMHMCKTCNGHRSQPFDRAYEQYSDYVAAHSDEMWHWEGISMQDMFGDDWRIKQLDLARYFAKHFGSRIVSEGVEVPRSLIDFMNGSSSAPGVSMCFAKHEDIWEMQRSAQGKGLRAGPFGMWLGDMNSYVSADRSQVVAIQTNSLIGYVGVELLWSARNSNMDSFFPHPHPVLNAVPADPALIDSIRSHTPGDSQS